ncbi:MAG: family transporter protein [Thermoleophilia bacterium]|jgi:ABC-type transport system involved in multi-copper enzyme maturation permease subunit|nr:family transporter protein [Thermoleophilia bacterium]
MRLLAITRLTLAELRHSRLLVLPLTVVVALVLVAANIQNPELYGDKLLDGSWAGLGVVGVLVAVLTASGAISSEIERGTMLLLAARPVSRATILAGKALGIAIYLLACAVVWAATLALTLGTQVDAGAAVAFWGGVLVFAPMLLAAMLALTASTVMPSRGAIGTTLAVWGAVAIVAAIPLSAVRPANVDRVELAQAVLGWGVPTQRLADLRDAAFGQAIPVDSAAALLVVAAWFSAALVVFSLRRSLAR